MMHIIVLKNRKGFKNKYAWKRPYKGPRSKDFEEKKPVKNALNCLLWFGASCFLCTFFARQCTFFFSCLGDRDFFFLAVRDHPKTAHRLSLNILVLFFAIAVQSVSFAQLISLWSHCLHVFVRTWHVNWRMACITGMLFAVMTDEGSQEKLFLHTPYYLLRCKICLCRTPIEEFFFMLCILCCIREKGI